MQHSDYSNIQTLGTKSRSRDTKTHNSFFKEHKKLEATPPTLIIDLEKECLKANKRIDSLQDKQSQSYT